MKRLYKIILAFFGTIFIAEIAAIISLSVILDNLSFRLNGEEIITLNLNEEYADEGATASTINWDLSDYITTSQSVDTSKVGIYYITYHLNFLNRHYSLDRAIEVIDNIPPEIVLNGDGEVRLYTGDEYTDAGATATDNYDGDITDRITTTSSLDTSQAGEYDITYYVEDTFKNNATISRKIIVENRPVLPSPAPAVANVNVPSTSSDPIADYIYSHNYDVSVGYYNLATGRSYFYQADRIYYGASLIKTLDAIYLYDNNMVDENLKYYIDRAILVSDNNAHRYLVDYIGRENLKNYGISLGAPNTLAGEGNYGDTTVLDQIIYYKKAYELAMKNSDFRAPFLNDSYNYIKVNGIPTMHKNGYYDTWFHDVGIVLDDEPYIVIILTNHGRGSQYNTVHSLAELVYKYHKFQL